MIIGLLGSAGVGKDSVGALLRDRAGFTCIAMADPMKRAAMEWFGFSTNQVWGPSAARNEIDPRWGVSPRTVLQRLGTEFGRSCNPDVWVRMAIATAAALLGPGFERKAYERAIGVVDLMNEQRSPAPMTWRDAIDRRGVAITDVRFGNEASAIRAAGGEVWRVARPGAGLTGAEGAHLSEVEQLSVECDRTIINDSTLEALAHRVLVAAQAKGSPR